MRNNRYKWILAISTTFAFSSFLSAQEGEGPAHLQVKRLNDSYIDVYYNKPAPGSQMPVLIFCQGSGYDSNTEGFLAVMQAFADKAVGMVVEKQGVKYGDAGDTLSEVYKYHNTVYNRLYDYLRVLQYLKKHAAWWNGDLYVIGGSEGGLLAGMLAAYYPGVKAAAIFSFGGGLNFGEAWPLSIGLQKKKEGASPAAVEKAVQQAKDTLNLARQNATFLQSYEGPDNTYAWWSSVADLRLENVLLDLDIPLFLVHGTEDIMAPLASAQKLQEAFLRSGKTNLHYKEYTGYDHTYNDKENNSHLVEVILEMLQQLLAV